MNEAEFIEENTEEGTAPEVAEVAEQEAPQLNETEQTAYDQGWRPEEEFEGKEGNWKTAKEYIKDGEFIGKINDLNRRMDAQKSEFDERLENTNKLNEKRRAEEVAELKRSQREAVNNADEELYDKAQAKLDSLEADKANETASAPGKDPAITAWEAKNAWINDPNDEKAAIAQGIWNNYANQNPNCTAQQALEHVDARLGKLYPVNNPRRDQPDSNETPVRKPRQNNKDLTMNDLTPAEQNEWNQFGSSIFKDQKSFLKAVKDTRVKS
jgi:hypothetical protein